MPCETAVPMAGETRVSRARVLTPAIILERVGEGGCSGLRSGQQLSRVTVGSEGGQGQEFLGVRECLLVHTSRVAAQPGNEGEESFLEAVHQRPQGRCCSLKRTPRWEAANILSSLVQLHGEGEGNFRWLGRGGICLVTIPDRPIGWIALNSTWEKMLLYERVFSSEISIIVLWKIINNISAAPSHF